MLVLYAPISALVALVALIWLIVRDFLSPALDGTYSFDRAVTPVIVFPSARAARGGEANAPTPPASAAAPRRGLLARLRAWGTRGTPRVKAAKPAKPAKAPKAAKAPVAVAVTPAPLTTVTTLVPAPLEQESAAVAAPPEPSSCAWLDDLGLPRMMPLAGRRRLLYVHARIATTDAGSRALLARVIATDPDLAEEASTLLRGVSA